MLEGTALELTGESSFVILNWMEMICMRMYYFSNAKCTNAGNQSINVIVIEIGERGGELIAHG